jgi:selenocysteine lyase/cysteine desulfurase
MTQLTYDISRAMAKAWSPGDEVVVTRLDHDANIRPWVQAAEAVGAVVRWAEFDPQSTELDLSDVEALLSSRTRLVAVTGASNLCGSRPPVAEIAAAAHAAGALVYVDGVHLTAHAAVDVAELGADLYACSPYKFLGPHCGVVAGRPEVLAGLHPDKLLPSTDVVPERFELGTLPRWALRLDPMPARDGSGSSPRWPSWRSTRRGSGLASRVASPSCPASSCDRAPPAVRRRCW